MFLRGLKRNNANRLEKKKTKKTNENESDDLWNFKKI